VLLLLLTAALRLPLDVWAYRHALAFGLSTRTLGGWLLDWGLARTLEVLTAGSVTLAGYALARRRPGDWQIISAPLGVLVLAAFAFSGPLVIEPLWFRITPLPDGPVRQQVGAVLEAAGNPQAPLLVADASRRTTRQNAYVSGLAGTRRVVLYDTLLEREPEEVALVVAHELAHARHHDLARGVAAGAAGWVVACWIVAATLRRRVETGRQPSVADPHGAAVAFTVVVVLMLLATPLGAWASRRAEAAADLAALQLTNRPDVYCAMQRGFVERNLTEPAPPPWLRLWAATHPPPASRLLLAERFAAAGAATTPSACR
jgi:STE24 endopeptidase